MRSLVWSFDVGQVLGERLRVALSSRPHRTHRPSVRWATVKAGFASCRTDSPIVCRPPLSGRAPAAILRRPLSSTHAKRAARGRAQMVHPQRRHRCLQLRFAGSHRCLSRPPAAVTAAAAAAARCCVRAGLVRPPRAVALLVLILHWPLVWPLAFPRRSPRRFSSPLLVSPSPLVRFPAARGWWLRSELARSAALQPHIVAVIGP